MKPLRQSRKFFLPRKFLLPVILIVFLLGGFFWTKLKLTDWNFDLVQNKEILNPLPSPTQKENLWNLLIRQGLNPIGLEVKDDEARATLAGNLVSYFSLGKDLPSQVVSLQFILTRAKIEGRLPKLVDLRFQKPVVSY